MATISEKQLGQQRPPTAGTPVSLYSPAAGVVGVIKYLTIANTSGAPANARVFVDVDGTTYDQTTAVIYDMAIAAGGSLALPVYWPMNLDAGNIACDTSVNNALTFTIWGLEIT